MESLFQASNGTVRSLHLSTVSNPDWQMSGKVCGTFRQPLGKDSDKNHSPGSAGVLHSTSLLSAPVNKRLEEKFNLK